MRPARRPLLALLLAPLLAAAAAAAPPQPALWEDGPARLSLRGGEILAEREGARALRGPRDIRSADLAGAVTLPGWGRLLLVSAATPSGLRLLGFVLDGRGHWSSAGEVPLGAGAVQAEPGVWAPDPAFPGPSPYVPLRLLAGRLVADAEAMPAPAAEALGRLRCPGEMPDGRPPPGGVEEAARRVAALPPAEAEAQGLRLAACLVLAGRPFEARRVLGAAAGRQGAARTPALERKLAGRLACSPHLAAVRRVSPPEKTFLQAECERPRS